MFWNIFSLVIKVNVSFFNFEHVQCFILFWTIVNSAFMSSFWEICNDSSFLNDFPFLLSLFGMGVKVLSHQSVRFWVCPFSVKSSKLYLSLRRSCSIISYRKARLYLSLRRICSIISYRKDSNWAGWGNMCCLCSCYLLSHRPNIVASLSCSLSCIKCFCLITWKISHILICLTLLLLLLCM